MAVGDFDSSGLNALGDITGNMSGSIAAQYGGGVDLGNGGGPTGIGGFDFGLDRGPREGVMSLQGNMMPSIGQPSSLGSIIGTILGIPASMIAGPLAGLAVKEAGKYGPGAVNSTFGLTGGSMLGPGGMPAPGEKSGGGGLGGLLGGLSPGPGMGAAGNTGGFGNLDPQTQLQLLVLLQTLQQGQGGGFFNPTGWPTTMPPQASTPAAY